MPVSGPNRPKTGHADPRRSLPSVENVAAEAARLMPANGAAPRALLTELARSRLADLRAAAISTADGDVLALAGKVAGEARRLLAGTIQPVINATGVILQTNLGRAPLSEAALARRAPPALAIRSRGPRATLPVRQERHDPRW